MDNDDKSPPLYMSVVNRILKELSLQPGAGSSIKFREMKDKIQRSDLTVSQMTFLQMRFDLIQWFLKETCPQQVREVAKEIKFQPGTILIVDLSCNHVTEADACSIYSIFLQIFLSQRRQRPLIIALDEAHKVRHFLSWREAETNKPAVSYREPGCQSIHRRSHCHHPPATPSSQPRRDSNTGAHHFTSTSRPLQCRHHPSFPIARVVSSPQTSSRSFGVASKEGRKCR